MIKNFDIKIVMDIILFSILYLNAHVLTFGNTSEIKRGFVLIREDRLIRSEASSLLLLVTLTHILMNVIAMLAALSGDENLWCELLKATTPIIPLIIWLLVFWILKRNSCRENENDNKLYSLSHGYSSVKRVGDGIVLFFIFVLLHTFIYSHDDDYGILTLIEPVAFSVLLFGISISVIIWLVLKRKKPVELRGVQGSAFIYSFLFFYSLFAVFSGALLVQESLADVAKIGQWMAFIFVSLIYYSFLFIVLRIVRMRSFLKHLETMEKADEHLNEPEKSFPVSLWQKLIVPLTVICYLGFVAGFFLWFLRS